MDMIETEKYGHYLVINVGEYIGWYVFAYEILRQTGNTTNVILVSTEE